MKYKAEFLWPNEDGSVEEAGYEFANARTDNYQRQWWRILLDRAKDERAPDPGGECNQDRACHIGKARRPITKSAQSP
jgi:hypothetical protein